MHNYVISLTSAIERRKHIESEFGKQDIPFEFFDAITPDFIDEKAKEFGIDISNATLTKGGNSLCSQPYRFMAFSKRKKLGLYLYF